MGVNMARYCKVCGSKSGRCNHVILELDRKEEHSAKQKDDKSAK